MGSSKVKKYLNVSLFVFAVYVSLGWSFQVFAANDFPYASDYKFESLPAHFGGPLDLDALSAVPKGSRISFVTYESLVKDYDGNEMQIRGAPQRFYKSDSYYQSLTDSSYFRGEITEVFHCRGFNKNGTIIKEGASVIRGTTGRVEGYEINTAAEICFADPNIYLVEYTHTHPAFEFYYGDSLASIRRNPLSPGDLQIVRAFSVEHPGIVLRSNAVVSNGYYYSVTVKDDKFIDDPLK